MKVGAQSRRHILAVDLAVVYTSSQWVQSLATGMPLGFYKRARAVTLTLLPPKTHTNNKQMDALWEVLRDLLWDEAEDAIGEALRYNTVVVPLILITICTQTCRPK